MLDRTIAPQAHQIEGMTLVVPKEYILENGLRIFTFESEDQDLIKAEFVFHNIFDTEENAIKNSAMSALLKEGTSTLSGADIAEKIDYYGAYLIPEYSFDHTGLTLYTLSKYIGDVLPTVWEVLNRATLPDEELTTYVRNNKQSLQISLEKTDFLARRAFYKTLFGNNRYGQSLNPELLDMLRRTELLELYEKQIRPDNCVLFLSGRITQDTLHKIFKLFGEEWSSDYPQYDPHPPLLTHKSTDKIFIEKTDAVQSSIRIGNTTISRQHKDYPAVQFVNILFGGYFGSRLMQNIREDKGYTYGIGSSIMSLKHTGLWTLSTQVGVDVTQATLQEIRKEMDILHQELTSEKEIALIQNYMLGAMLGSLESIFSHADKFRSVYLSDMTLSYYSYYTEVIKSMDAQQIRDIAQQYFNLDKAVEVVVGRTAN